MVLVALRRSKNNVTLAARHLRIPRVKMYPLMKKHDITNVVREREVVEIDPVKLARALVQTGGDVRRAAKLMGMGATKVYSHLRIQRIRESRKIVSAGMEAMNLGNR